MMKKIAIPSLALLLTLLQVSCSREDFPVSDGIGQHELKVLDQGNLFGFDLFTRISRQNPDSNLCLSPYSIYSALAMAANGAGGETLDEFLNLLGTGENDLESLDRSIRTIDSILIAKDPATVFETANSVWYNNVGFSVYPSFSRLMTVYFDAQVNGLDFGSPDVLPAINGWVSDKTHGKIQKILESVNPQDLCFLINALYFNGKWTNPFERKFTQMKGFTNSDGKRVEVPTMEMWDSVGYMKDDDVRAIVKPYGDESWGMYLFLPPVGADLDEWIEGSLSVQWPDWQKKMETKRKLEVFLPQVKVETFLDLSNVLAAMGIPTAFSAQADFSGLGPGELFISQVLHKTYIDVNEDGTEAAAVTLVGWVGAGPPEYEIRFNRPFVFVIAEKSTGSILFIGKVVSLG
jgi:serine protease inhibitor